MEVPECNLAGLQKNRAEALADTWWTTFRLRRAGGNEGAKAMILLEDNRTTGDNDEHNSYRDECMMSSLMRTRANPAGGAAGSHDEIGLLALSLVCPKIK